MKPMKKTRATDARISAMRRLLFFCSGVMGLGSSTNHAGCAGIEPGRRGKGVERGWRRDLPFQTLGNVPRFGGGLFTIATPRNTARRHEEIPLRQPKTETAHGGNCVEVAKWQSFGPPTAGHAGQPQKMHRKEGD